MSLSSRAIATLVSRHPGSFPAEGDRRGRGEARRAIRKDSTGSHAKAGAPAACRTAALHDARHPRRARLHRIALKPPRVVIAAESWSAAGRAAAPRTTHRHDVSLAQARSRGRRSRGRVLMPRRFAELGRALIRPAPRRGCRRQHGRRRAGRRRRLRRRLGVAGSCHVAGGVGPMTIPLLLRNTVRGYRRGPVSARDARPATHPLYDAHARWRALVPSPASRCRCSRPILAENAPCERGPASSSLPMAESTSGAAPSCVSGS